MKRILALFLALAMTFSMVACTGNENQSQKFENLTVVEIAHENVHNITVESDEIHFIMQLDEHDATMFNLGDVVDVTVTLPLLWEVGMSFSVEVENPYCKGQGFGMKFPNG